jgi:hypothetical protein
MSDVYSYDGGSSALPRTDSRRRLLLQRASSFNERLDVNHMKLPIGRLK